MIKLAIIAWFIGAGLLFIVLTAGFDAIYENAYFNKLDKAQQEIVMNWLESDEL